TCQEHRIKNVYHHDPVVVTTVQRILLDFKSKNEITLMAPTQSGKSDPIKRICELAHDCTAQMSADFKIDNVFVVICAADNDLKDQHTKNLTRYVDRSHILHLK